MNMRTLLALLLSSVATFAAPALPSRGFVQEYDSVVQALAASPQQISTTYEIKGLFAINDGEGGTFHYYAGDTTATNATDCFEWGSGRLRRYFLGLTASRLNVFGSSTNTAGELNLDSYLRLGYVVPSLGAGTVAVFDANGVITNGLASGFITAGDGITVSGSTVSTDLAEGSNITLSTNGSGTITITAASGASGANPTASVGLSAVNGVAVTFMRSDAAPALESVGTPGTYGDASNFPVVTTDAAGRVTAVTLNAVSAGQTNPAAANPTGTVGLSTVNGTAPTFLRSDGAPPLSQGIAPTWTESHRYTKNVFALRSTGASTYLDANFPSPTNLVSAAIAITHATNGVDHQESVIVWTLNSDGGGDRALTLPLQSSGVNGWLTNKAQTFPTVVTNDTTVVLYGRFKGATDTLAKQTNFMLLGVEYY